MTQVTGHCQFDKQYNPNQCWLLVKWTLKNKSYCSAEGYYGSLDRAHDILTDICHDHVIWWPRRGWTKWIQNWCTVVMTHKDLCTCIVWTKWNGPITCVNVIENVENFQSKFYRNQNFCDSISEATSTWQSYPLHVFCWFQRNKDDTTIVAQHMCDLVTIPTKWPSQRREWIFPQDACHVKQELMKRCIKVPQS